LNQCIDCVNYIKYIQYKIQIHLSLLQKNRIACAFVCFVYTGSTFSNQVKCFYSNHFLPQCLSPEKFDSAKHAPTLKCTSHTSITKTVRHNPVFCEVSVQSYQVLVPELCSIGRITQSITSNSERLLWFLNTF